MDNILMAITCELKNKNQKLSDLLFEGIQNLSFKRKFTEHKDFDNSQDKYEFDITFFGISFVQWEHLVSDIEEFIKPHNHLIKKMELRYLDLDYDGKRKKLV